ncbi:flagellar basal-body MS-ring/collar protein FliF [Salinicola sp. DM10]|uniref:flagellar basal-body MS-ring/collar protein FliF n=1 Tax=Salinicola sp. DM10 TaxID=2815721 RepID=UPI001A8D20AD|nr:flagellar basal-body MS-ring/collar protein FliF [Salinicola sp. DM10]MCE3025805.1 flagellar M-ring protein FliF [Salinicola sp. DM10]
MSTATSPNDTQAAGAQSSSRAGAAQKPGRDWLSKLQGNPRIPLIVAGAAALAIVVALLLWARAPDYRVLYSTLTDADGGRIITQLDAMGVPYRFSEGGQALLVPADQVRPLRLKLAEQGLPQASGVGFELMDNQAFGISQFAEQVNYQRALEGELARTIATLGSVERARVHLAMAKPSVFVRESEPASASVVVDLQPGRVLSPGQVNAIVHMVSSSVPELATNAVTVIDQNGDLLTRDQGDGTRLDGTQLDYVHNLEKTYAERIEAILAPIVGAKNVKAQVTAQVDFAQREQTAERYGPNQGANEAAVRSEQNSASYQSDADLAMGIPGALSNQPPGTAASPINAPGTQANANGGNNNAGNNNAANNNAGNNNGNNAGNNNGNNNAGQDQTTQNGNAQTGQMRRDSTINYEVDRTVEHVKQHSGALERLSVAVVVNYRETTGEDGQPKTVALSDAEMDQIRGLVRQAMGYSQARGDDLAVVNSPFQTSEPTFTPEPWWQSPEIWSLGQSVLKYLLVALVAMFLWFKVVKPLVRRQTRDAQPAAFNAPSGVSGAAGAASYQQVSEADGDDEPAPVNSTRERSRRRSSGYEQDLKDAREIAQEDPRLVAMVVRSWMEDKS